MMAQSRAESTRDTYNYGQYLNQFPLNTIKVIREFARIHKRICRHKISIMFNEICINEEMLPKYTYIYIYIYANIDLVGRVFANGLETGIQSQVESYQRFKNITWCYLA